MGFRRFDKKEKTNIYAIYIFLASSDLYFKKISSFITREFFFLIVRGLQPLVHYGPCPSPGTLPQALDNFGFNPPSLDWKKVKSIKCTLFLN